MSWYRTGTVSVTNGSKTVTGVGTLWTSAVSAGDAFALVDANLNPTGAWYEVESVTNNTTLVLKQSYAGSTGSNKTYCVFNLVGNMTTPSFAQRLATFFASFQSLIDKPTTTPTASSIPVADSGGKIADGWIPTTVARTASPTLTGTPAAPTAPKATNTTQLATTAHVKSVVADYAPLASPTLTGTPTAPTAAAGTNTTQVATTAFVNTGINRTGLGTSAINQGPTDANNLVTPGVWGSPGVDAVNWGVASYGWIAVHRRNARILQIAIDHSGGMMQLRVSSDTGATWGDWHRQYSQDNILGTVSQSGGVPTGAVIERGSNANGEYVKFADGTMICMKAEAVNLFDYVSGDYQEEVTLPARFVNTTYSISVHFTSNTVANAQRVTSMVASRPASSTTSAFLVYISIASTVGGNNYVSYSAIGRWF